MFDKHYSYTENPPVVINRQAPTHESVRLLREMEEAARNKLIDHGEIKNNIISAKWSVSQGVTGVDLAGIVAINGVVKRFYKEYSVPKNREEIEDIIIDFVRDKIAAELLKSFVESGQQKYFKDSESHLIKKKYD